MVRKHGRVNAMFFYFGERLIEREEGIYSYLHYVIGIYRHLQLIHKHSQSIHLSLINIQ